MDYYPVYVKVAGKTCLVVGGGEVGTRKVEGLLACNARVRLVAEQFGSRVQAAIDAGKVELAGSSYQESHLDGCFLVIAATNDLDLNLRVAAEAEKRGLLCNVVDFPRAGNFIVPAVVRRGALSIAISTGGRSPAMARRLKEKLEAQFGAEYDIALAIMGAVRQRVLERGGDPEANKAKFEQILDSDLLQLVRRGDRQGVDAVLRRVLGEGCSLDDLEIEW